jgi:hypothetical protein
LAAGALSASCTPVMVASAGVSALQYGTAAFVNGELEAAHVADLETVYQAALDTVRDLKFREEFVRVTDRTGYIHVRELTGRRIKIFLEARSSIVTKINIRVGVFGDQAISRLLLGEIQARCPAVPGVEPDGSPQGF